MSNLHVCSTEASRTIAEEVQLFKITVSFGSVGSAISLPCYMSHASIPAEVRAARGLPDDLVRISVGLEDPQDLLEGLLQDSSCVYGALLIGTCMALCMKCSSWYCDTQLFPFLDLQHNPNMGEAETGVSLPCRFTAGYGEGHGQDRHGSSCACVRQTCKPALK